MEQEREEELVVLDRVVMVFDDGGWKWMGMTEMERKGREGLLIC